jgi:hypothetical protein
MFGIIKFIFYTSIAVVVGILIGTVPVGGRTVADRIMDAYEFFAGKPQRKTDLLPSKSSSQKKDVRVSKRKPLARPKARNTKAVSLAATNAPENRTAEEKAKLSRIILTKTSSR